MTARGLNIAAIARRTGVAPDTLRKWEQRYGALQPSRTAGGQRRYSERDIARVAWLRDRLSEGYRIGEAAALLESAPPEPARTPGELRAALLAALRRDDAAAVGALLDHAFAAYTLQQTLGEVVRPALEDVGDAWASNELSVAQEHLLSTAVRAQLERVLVEVPRGIRGTAVLACPPDERHELGLLMLAVLLRADGWHVAYLGADTPVRDALGLAAKLSARFVALSVAMNERLWTLRDALRAEDGASGVALVVGGAAANGEAARELGARYEDADLPSAVTRLRKLAA